MARYVRLYPQSYAPDGAAVRLNYIGCNFADKGINRPTVPFFQPPTGAFVTPPLPNGVTSPGTTQTTSSTLAPPTPFYVEPSKYFVWSHPPQKVIIVLFESMN